MFVGKLLTSASLGGESYALLAAKVPDTHAGVSSSCEAISSFEYNLTPSFK